ncbi:hypothetical protein BYT27DRAFT_7217652 [Phlegmacium glaucopus]|nr:hypothetical protein BYT27DRAFT_7217652 [Phlegmacium glaucopus]
MEKKCETCDKKEKPCVVGKGKRRCTECESSKTKCSFVDGQRGPAKSTTQQKAVVVAPRAPKRKRGVKTSSPPRATHLPFVQLTARSPATLPVVPGYLTTNAPNTSTHLRMELELAQARNIELEEDVVRLRDGLRAAERALQRTRETAAHEREVFRARIEALGGAASLED